MKKPKSIVSDPFGKLKFKNQLFLNHYRLLQGDYYIPCLELPAEKEERHMGVWGQRHFILRRDKVRKMNL